ncbi:hypothetical protein NLJ89_g2659 [Agrocybe chaxingu]|uniref:Uncharacterized protein n=1 Tax=Agrocybe chaxingu TaxID=84603 RepID=A0A9W8KC18_9AGAR|nr:hypothetical protein NLJ89_g2659 [Agrocybe chaxingu]
MRSSVSLDGQNPDEGFPLAFRRAQANNIEKTTEMVKDLLDCERLTSYIGVNHSQQPPDIISGQLFRRRGSAGTLSGERWTRDELCTLRNAINVYQLANQRVSKVPIADILEKIASMARIAD